MTDPLTYVLACLRRAADNSYPWSVTPGEAGALVSEVERLRAENAALVQTSADLCIACGWRFFVPGDGCQKCELDRLRGHAADLRLMVDGLENAAHEERAAVVAYLRACNKRCHEWDGRENAVSGTYRLAADDIERGYHRTGTKP